MTQSEAIEVGQAYGLGNRRALPATKVSVTGFDQVRVSAGSGVDHRATKLVDVVRFRYVDWEGDGYMPALQFGQLATPINDKE